MSDYPYNAGNMTMIIPLAKFAELHDKIKIRDAENDRLKTENERLTLLQAETLSERIKAKAQIKRLTKAGDAIYQSFDQFGQVDAKTLKRWQTAREGKQS